MTQFFSTKMKLPNREIDSNYKVFKTDRDHSVKLVLSDLKFKKFIFIARRNMRSENPESCDDFFINEKLTHYNYELLKTLKNEKKRRTTNKLPNFRNAYSFEGRIYVKKLGIENDRQEAIPISSRKSLETFLNQLN